MMMHLSRLLTLLLLTLCLASPALAGSEKKAARLADKAEKALMVKSDPLRAVEMADKALALDPYNTKALGVAAFTRFAVASMVGGADAQGLLAEGMPYFNQLQAVDPSSPYVELCLSIIGPMYQGPLIPEPPEDCSPEAVQAFEQAEANFASGNIGGAAPFYEKALQLCPTAAKWWTYYGDVFFNKGDYDKARAQYQRALEISPCYWSAHRFMADSYLKQGDSVRAREHAITAVACNPSYEIGWSYLASVQQSLGREMLYLDVGKPQLVIEGDETQVQLATEGPFAGSAGIIWSAAQVAEGQTDPLGAQRAAARGIIDMLGGLQGDALQQPDNQLWLILAQADAAGLLDEAILVLLLDESLVPQFLALRDGDRSSLERFIGEFLAPLHAP